VNPRLRAFGPCADYDVFNPVPDLALETGMGGKTSFPYDQLRSYRLTAEGLVLLFSHHRVTIHGQRLPVLAALIDRHRVVRIGLAPQIETPPVAEPSPWITQIAIETSTDPNE
jgi:hypothetical protein